MVHLYVTRDYPFHPPFSSGAEFGWLPHSPDPHSYSSQQRFVLRFVFPGICTNIDLQSPPEVGLRGQGDRQDPGPRRQGSELESSLSPVLLLGNSELPRDSLLIHKVGLLCILDIRINQKWPPSGCMVLPPTPSITTATKPASGD